MNNVRSLLVATAAVLLLVAGARAQEPIRFARTPDISPDGKLWIIGAFHMEPLSVLCMLTCILTESGKWFLMVLLAFDHQR